LFCRSECKTHGRMARHMGPARDPGLEKTIPICHLAPVGTPIRDSGRPRAACKAISRDFCGSIISPAFRRLSLTTLSTRDVSTPAFGVCPHPCEAARPHIERL
jgi:hypothetical protein